jgi:hypothetical protein
MMENKINEDEFQNPFVFKPIGKMLLKMKNL